MCIDKTDNFRFASPLEIPRGPETSQQAGPRHLKEALEDDAFGVVDEEFFEAISTDLDAIYSRLENVEIENDHLVKHNKMLDSMVKHLDNKVSKLTTAIITIVFYLIVWLVGWGFGAW